MGITLSQSASAFVATAAISILPNFVFFLYPQFDSKNDTERLVLLLGQALAAGGLLGDVFLHGLPHAMMSSAHSENEIIKIGQYVLLGFILFLVCDGMIHSITDNQHHHHTHEHEHHVHISEEYQKCSKPKLNGSQSAQNTLEEASSRLKQKKSPTEEKIHSRTGWRLGGPWKVLRRNPTAVLNLVADSMHNFTDGLTIGASFQGESSSHMGIVASISVIFHEIPHEIGDYSILLSSGFSRSEAMVAQMMTALPAFLGTAVGFTASSRFGSAGSMVSFTSGGFLYLAACSLLPEIVHAKCNWRWRLGQLAAFCLGIVCMQLVAYLEDHDHDSEDAHGHHHDHHHHYNSHHHHSPNSMHMEDPIDL